MITLVTTPELPGPPGRGRFKAALSLVTTVIGELVCICDVMVAPPRGDASTVMDRVLLLVPSVLDTRLDGDCRMTSALEFTKRCTTDLPTVVMTLFVYRG